MNYLSRQVNKQKQNVEEQFSYKKVMKPKSSNSK